MIYLSFPQFFAQYWPLYAGLAGFGTAFNWAVAQLERRGYTRGYTALLVAVGCGVTLASLAVAGAPYAMGGLDWGAASLVAFAASGAPMIVGSAYRYAREREQERQKLAALMARLGE